MVLEGSPCQVWDTLSGFLAEIWNPDRFGATSYPKVGRIWGLPGGRVHTTLVCCAGGKQRFGNSWGNWQRSQEKRQKLTSDAQKAVTAALKEAAAKDGSDVEVPAICGNHGSPFHYSLITKYPALEMQQNLHRWSCEAKKSFIDTRRSTRRVSGFQLNSI